MTSGTFYNRFERHAHGEGLKGQSTHYCAGCGHGIVHKFLAEAIDELGIQNRTIAVSPVSCSVFLYYYLDVGNTQAAHGRAPAVAIGHKLANPDSVVVCYQGDGDLASIGLAEIVSTAQSGFPISVVFVNNAIYGMTGGQMAPTTLMGQKTATSPEGRLPWMGQPAKMAVLMAQSTARSTSSASRSTTRSSGRGRRRRSRRRCRTRSTGGATRSSSSSPCAPPTGAWTRSRPPSGWGRTSTETLLTMDMGASGIVVEEASGAPQSQVDEAAILYASGQTEMAERLLKDVLATGDRRAWHMLFDLYSIQNREKDFEQLALDYAMRFETSPPVLQKIGGNGAHKPQQPQTASLELPGLLDKKAAATLREGIAGTAKNAVVRIDFSRIEMFDETGADECAQILSAARKAKRKLEARMKRLLCRSIAGLGLLILLLPMFMFAYAECNKMDTSGNWMNTDYYDGDLTQVARLSPAIVGGGVPAAAGGIANVSHDQGISDVGGSLTISSFACDATNDYIVVAIASINNALVSGVTYAATETFTQLVGYYGANNTCSVWGGSPTATSGNILIAVTAGRDVLAVAYCLSGVDQSTPSEDTDLDYGARISRKPAKTGKPRSAPRTLPTSGNM